MRHTAAEEGLDAASAFGVVRRPSGPPAPAGEQQLQDSEKFRTDVVIGVEDATSSR